MTRAAGSENAFAADPEAVYAFVGTFFDSLCAASVRHVVVSPGSRSTPLAITARRTPGLHTWIELDERAAGFFALGLAKESRVPAVLVCTSGTAAANYLPAIIEAHYSRVPLIVATADRPHELRDWGAGQTIEQVGLYGRYPRWATEVPVPVSGPDALRYANQLGARAVAEATGRPSGAVHLNWPLREPLAPPGGDSVGGVGDARVRPAMARLLVSESKATATGHDIAALLGSVRKYERGILCCGPMDPDPEFEAALIAFATAAGWPILADPASNLRTGEAGCEAAVLDCGDLLPRSPAFASRINPEVVIRVGQPPVSKAQRLWLESAEPAETWWLDRGEVWAEPSHRATRIVRGGTTSLLNEVANALDPEARTQGTWWKAFQVAQDVSRGALQEATRSGDPNRAADSGLDVASAVVTGAPAGARLFASNSMSIRLLDVALEKRAEPLRVLSSRGASGIDGVTSTALGVAASAMDRRGEGEEGSTILLTGDLAFLHDLSGLLLPARETIPLTIVVIDDEGGGIFSFLPVAAGGERVSFDELFRTPPGVDLARAADLFGLAYHEVDLRAEPAEGEDLALALERALVATGTSIVHVRVDAARNESRFRGVVAAATAAITESLASDEA